MLGPYFSQEITDMPPKYIAQLAVALRRRKPVRFSRPFEEGTISGYVLGIGPRFFLMAVLGDDMRFDGFQCLRLSDVRRLQSPHPYETFVEAVLKKRGEPLPGKPRVKLASLGQLLRSANRAFPLVTIQRERTNPDGCEIGRVLAVNEKQVSFLEIGPDAVWDEEPKAYRLGEITRVDFGGGYEEALHLVGGK